MSTFHTHHSGYAGALVLMEKCGGQLFPRRGRDGTTTLVIGQQVHTFWEEDSHRYFQCKVLAEDIGFPHENFTPGRLAKYIIRDICGLPDELGQPDDRILQLARNGFHWHYTHVETGYHPYLLEFDLCQAYATSLAQFGSFCFSMSQPTINDCGSLENLRNLLPSLPKWIRLVMVGVIASHRMTFATMPNRKSGDVSLKFTTIREVKYGQAFNQVHRAILRLYRVCKRLHSIGGIHIKRMHTDSFALSVDCPNAVEQNIFEYLDEQGFSYTCKAQGTAHFLDLNSGIVGRKFIGVPCEVREAIKAQPVPNRRVHITSEQLQRWGIRGVLADTGSDRSGQQAAEPIQLELGVSDGQGNGRDARYSA